MLSYCGCVLHFLGKKTQTSQNVPFFFNGRADKKKEMAVSGCCYFWTVSLSLFCLLACTYDPVLLPLEFMVAFPLIAVV